MKTWVLKWALTRGVVIVETEMGYNSNVRVVAGAKFGRYTGWHKSVCAFSEEEARDKVRIMAEKRLAAMSRERERLGKLLGDLAGGKPVKEFKP